jgi:hypothetical protein
MIIFSFELKQFAIPLGQPQWTAESVPLLYSYIGIRLRRLRELSFQYGVSTTFRGEIHPQANPLSVPNRVWNKCRQISLLGLGELSPSGLLTGMARQGRRRPRAAE